MHAQVPHRVTGAQRLSLLVLLLAPACSKGSFTGEVTEPAASGAPGGAKHDGSVQHFPARHEDVAFTWQSINDSLSGHIQTTLPGGESFKGKYHEIVTNVPIDEVNQAYGSWYAGPWASPGWYWGGAWPYYDTVEGFVEHYTGKVVALLKGDRGGEMRCMFSLTDRYGGMRTGGRGECQLSNGDRITAKFGPSS